MQTAARPRRKNLRHGFACSECERARKRCDGQRPCERCARMGKTCADGKAALRRMAKDTSGLDGGLPVRAPKRGASRMDTAAGPARASPRLPLPSRWPPDVGVVAHAEASTSTSDLRDSHAPLGDGESTMPSDPAALGVWVLGPAQAGAPPLARPAGARAATDEQVTRLASPSPALSPRVRLFDAPLWSPQGVAAWSRVVSCATDSGRLGQLESGIRHLMESTPAASAMLGVPFRVATWEGREVGPHELPPGHHPAHSCAKVGMAAGGSYGPSSFVGLEGRAVKGLPLGFDDVVEVALSSSHVPVFRTVFDDVTEFPIL